MVGSCWRLSDIQIVYVTPVLLPVEATADPLDKLERKRVIVYSTKLPGPISLFHRCRMMGAYETDDPKKGDSLCMYSEGRDEPHGEEMLEQITDSSLYQHMGSTCQNGGCVREKKR